MMRVSGEGVRVRSLRAPPLSTVPARSVLSYLLLLLLLLPSSRNVKERRILHTSPALASNQESVKKATRPVTFFNKIAKGAAAFVSSPFKTLPHAGESLPPPRIGSALSELV